MKCTVHIDPSREEELLIYAHRETPLVAELQQLAAAQESLVGSADGQYCRLDPLSVFCFIVQDGKTLAITRQEQWQVKLRLYQLEEQLGERFIRINQSCLINRHRIERFKTTFGGALQVVMQNGFTDYVSRRQLKAVKERMGLL